MSEVMKFQTKLIQIEEQRSYLQLLLKIHQYLDRDRRLQLFQQMEGRDQILC